MREPEGQLEGEEVLEVQTVALWQVLSVRVKVAVSEALEHGVAVPEELRQADAVMLAQLLEAGEAVAETVEQSVGD